MGNNFVKTVACKACSKTFVIEYDNSQAGFSKCSKKYCSKECKRSAKKDLKSGNRHQLNCQECDKTYYLPPSLSKQSRFCSRICQNRAQAKQKVIGRFEQTCQNCHKQFEILATSKRKYCSLICSNIASRSPRVNQECQFCHKVFEKYESIVTRFCGRNCQYAAQSSGLIKINTHGRSGKRIDLDQQYFRSALEADYARYCMYIGLEFVYEPKTFRVNELNDRVKYYTPDFFLPSMNLYVETKAGRPDGAYEDNLSAVESLQQQGINVTVVFMKDFYEMLKDKGLYAVIPNLERRNYKHTRHLVI
jgi:hypothetical protein